MFADNNENIFFILIQQTTQKNMCNANEYLYDDDEE